MITFPGLTTTQARTCAITARLPERCRKPPSRPASADAIDRANLFAENARLKKLTAGLRGVPGRLLCGQPSRRPPRSPAAPNTRHIDLPERRLGSFRRHPGVMICGCFRPPPGEPATLPTSFNGRLNDFIAASSAFRHPTASHLQFLPGTIFPVELPVRLLLHGCLGCVGPAGDWSADSAHAARPADLVRSIERRRGRRVANLSTLFNPQPVISTGLIRRPYATEIPRTMTCNARTIRLRRLIPRHRHRPPLLTGAASSANRR